MQQSRFRKPWLLLAAKIGLSTLFGLVLLELGLRLMRTCPPPPHASQLADMPIDRLIEHAANESWIHKPSTQTRVHVPEEQRDIVIRRNWCSCREDEETPLEKPAGTYRILVLGDSHTDGIVSNNESYANLLEGKVDDRFDVMNCGQSVTSPISNSGCISIFTVVSIPITSWSVSMPATIFWTCFSNTTGFI